MNEEVKAGGYPNRDKGVGHIISKLIEAHLIQYTSRDKMDPRVFLYHRDTIKIFESLIDTKIGLMK